MAQLTRNNVEAGDASVLADITALFALCNVIHKSTENRTGLIEWCGLAPGFTVCVTATAGANEAAVDGTTGATAVVEQAEEWAISHTKYGP